MKITGIEWRDDGEAVGCPAGWRTFTLLAGGVEIAQFQCAVSHATAESGLWMLDKHGRGKPISVTVSAAPANELA